MQISRPAWPCVWGPRNTQQKWHLSSSRPSHQLPESTEAWDTVSRRQTGRHRRPTRTARKTAKTELEGGPLIRTCLGHLLADPPHNGHLEAGSWHLQG